MLKEEIHGGEGVWMCEACEKSPAAFICKADSAVLCSLCDSDIHSANPLAQRHHRVPIVPNSGTLYGPDSIRHHNAAENDRFLPQQGDEIIDEDQVEEAASWLLFNPVKNINQVNHNGSLFGGEIDEYLDLDDYNTDQQNRFGEQKIIGGDSVVPVPNFHPGIEYEAPNIGYSYPASFTHNVSASSMDVGVVPDSLVPEGSISHPSVQMPTPLGPMDREARVLRYREKKKARKFEKTIRYASRKAYAETRPRIKGRFAKRTDVEVEVDYMFSKTLMADNGFVVPSY